MEKKTFNKTTFIQKFDRSTRSVIWNCRKGGFNIQIAKYAIGWWYIMATRKKDNATWNSLWTDTRWTNLDEAMEFASNFNEKNITDINY